MTLQRPQVQFLLARYTISLLYLTFTSKQNLGATLHTLSPRPQVFITGAGITPEMSEEAVGVWNEYLKNVGPKENHLINVRLFVDAELPICNIPDMRV